MVNNRKSFHSRVASSYSLRPRKGVTASTSDSPDMHPRRCCSSRLVRKSKSRSHEQSGHKCKSSNPKRPVHISASLTPEQLRRKDRLLRLRRTNPFPFAAMEYFNCLNGLYYEVEGCNCEFMTDCRGRPGEILGIDFRARPGSCDDSSSSSTQRFFARVHLSGDEEDVTHLEHHVSDCFIPGTNDPVSVYYLHASCRVCQPETPLWSCEPAIPETPVWSCELKCSEPNLIRGDLSRPNPDLN